MVYVRNTLQNLQEASGGQTIYDSLAGITGPPNNTLMQANIQNMQAAVNNTQNILIRRNNPPIAPREGGLVDSMQNILDQIQRRLNNNNNQPSGHAIANRI